MTDDARRIMAEAIFGAATRKGLVKISDQATDGSDVRWTMLMSPDRARSIAQSLLEAAEAAEMDEVVVTFLHQRIGLQLEQAAQVLGDFRKIRDQITLERGL
jgi:hypothetical protein